MLAIPGAIAGIALVFAIITFAGGGLASLEGAAVLGAMIGLLIVPLIGAYLLMGYWTAVRRDAPMRHPQRFWWLSAAYNAVGVFAAFSDELPTFVGQAGHLSAPILAGWAVFMVWVGATRAAASEVPV